VKQSNQFNQKHVGFAESFLLRAGIVPKCPGKLERSPPDSIHWIIKEWGSGVMLKGIRY
jgi:hypothetical protein